VAPGGAKKGALHSHFVEVLPHTRKKNTKKHAKVFLHAFLFAMSFDVVIFYKNACL
jgi:hypothetical protein